MGTSLRIFSIFGIPVSVHLSWVVIFLFFSYIFVGYYGSMHPSWTSVERWTAGVATSLLLSLSVLAHELSHSLVAMRLGTPVRGITLFIFGGVSHIGQEARKPSAEFIIAVVGPVSSVVLGFIFLGLAFSLAGVSAHLSSIAWILVYVNITLGVFNMLPGFPLDGGRVLRAVVWQITRNYLRATKLATLGGFALATAMIAGGITLAVLDPARIFQGIWTMAIGVFLQIVVYANYREVRMDQSLNGYTAADMMITNVPAALGHTPLSQIMAGYMAHAGADFLLLTEGGSPLGIITPKMARKVPGDRWNDVPAIYVMEPLEKAHTVSGEEPAYSLMEALDSHGADYVLVMDNDGILLGLITKARIRGFAKTLRESKTGAGV